MHHYITTTELTASSLQMSQTFYTNLDSRIKNVLGIVSSAQVAAAARGAVLADFIPAIVARHIGTSQIPLRSYLTKPGSLHFVWVAQKEEFVLTLNTTQSKQAACK